MGEIGSDLGEILPCRSFRHLVPIQQRLQRIRVDSTKLPDRGLTDDPHVSGYQNGNRLSSRDACSLHARGPGVAAKPEPQQEGARYQLVPQLCVLQLCQMSRAITIRLTEELARWLEESSRRTGLPARPIIPRQLEKPGRRMLII